jgi:photosystem II stability/assembly factor-like uncharacterized protein
LDGEGGGNQFEMPQSPEEVDEQRDAFPASAVPDGARQAAFAAWTALAQNTAASGDHFPVRWHDLGPAPLDVTPPDSHLPNMGPNSGRATGIAVQPDNSNVMYLGTANGGVWKTSDGGATWNPTSDHEQSLAIGAVAIDPQSPQTVYAGTGEANLDRESFEGAGILKSTDAGAHWTLLGTAPFAGLTISKIVVDSSSAVYVSTQIYGVTDSAQGCSVPLPNMARSGLFKSTDGGATWTQLISGWRVSDFTIDPRPGPRKIIVGIHRSGIVIFDEASGKITPTTGLPTAVRRIILARAASNPLLIYAGVEQNPSKPVAKDFASLFRSTDGGASWTEIPGTPNYCGSQCVYDNAVAVDPTNPDIVYLGGSLCSIWKMSDGTKATPQFLPISMPGHVCAEDTNPDAWELDNVHPDVHALVFDPSNPGKLYVANDGGIAFTSDGGNTWNKINNTIETTQFAKVCVDQNDGSIVGGMRDNGTAEWQPGSRTWKGRWVGDGGGCVANLHDPVPANRFMLVSAQYGDLKRIDGNGKVVQDNDLFDPGTDRAPYVDLLVADPSNPQRVYLGTQRVWRSTSGGAAKTWQPISGDVTAGAGNVVCADNSTMDDFLTAIAVAPSASNVIYTASAGGVLSVSKDDGASWQFLTSPILPHRWATGLAIDPFDSNIVYVSFAGFSRITPQTPGHLFRSTDGGATWQRVDASVDALDTPFEAVLALPLLPNLPNVLFVGTEFGVLVTLDGGATWQPLRADQMPNVPVYDLAFDIPHLSLVAATHGRGIWRAGLR